MTHATTTTPTTAAEQTNVIAPNCAPTLDVARLIREATTSMTLSDRERLRFLPNLFDGDIAAALRFEGNVYDMMGTIRGGYGGGLWEFVSLLNSGGFMFLPECADKVEIRFSFGNAFGG